MGASDPDADADTEGEPRAVLVDCLFNPAESRGRLPRVLGLLDADDRGTRLAAGWVCCLVAVETDDPDVVEYLLRRLTDRLDDDPSLEVTQTLDYLSTLYADQAVDVLGAVAAERGDDTPLPAPGEFTRGHHRGAATERDGAGRTRVADDADAGPRRVYADREREEREQVAHEREREAADEEESGDGGGGSSEEDGEAGDPRTAIERTNVMSSVATHSRFDQLHIVGARSRGRYAHTYEALVGEDGEERAVAVRLFRGPDDLGDQPTYEQRLAERVSEWAGVDDHPGVMGVLDWNTDPRPWVATLFVGESLADRGRARPEQAREEALALVDAVSHLHGNGVVHGGLDPTNVSYPGELIDGDGTARSPRLDNVGLMLALRYHVQPALCLNPRFAAPEYFDDRYGRVDHETDVYGLGAVVYYLFTGRPPYTGGLEEVRQAVVEGGPPRPSAVADVPAGVDEVVAKAMATQKLTRYETVEHMRTDLEGVGDG